MSIKGKRRKIIDRKKSREHLRMDRLDTNGIDYDIKKVLAWTAPKEDGAPIIAMPNIPTPIHGLAPRTVLGSGVWNHMRKRCYYMADYKSQISGIELDKSDSQRVPNAHELYSYNYITGEALFVRAVCISPLEHNFIHSGRMLTMYKKGNPLMPKQYVLKCLENGFKIIKEWNDANPDKRPLRAYYTIIEYAMAPGIAEEVRELIDKYDIKFYMEDREFAAKWSDWHLIVGKNSYQTPYANKDEWRAAMEEGDANNQNAALGKELDIYKDIQEIIDLSELE